MLDFSKYKIKTKLPNRFLVKPVLSSVSPSVEEVKDYIKKLEEYERRRREYKEVLKVYREERKKVLKQFKKDAFKALRIKENVVGERIFELAWIYGHKSLEKVFEYMKDLVELIELVEKEIYKKGV